MERKANTVLIILAFFSIYVIWGSTYLLNKIAVAELPPFMLASIRFIIAGTLIFGICKILRLRTGISNLQLKNTALGGFLFLCLGNGLVVWALKYMDSGFAALEISAQPLVVLLLLRIIDGKKIKTMSIIGVFLGILGMYMLVSQQEVLNNKDSLIGMGMIFICLLSWAYGSIFVSKADLPANYFVNTGYQMLFGGIMLFITSLLFGEQWSSPIAWSAEVQFSMIVLIFLGSIVAFTSFNYLLKVVSPEKVATSTYVNPIIAMVLGWYFLKEQVTAQSALAALVLLTGVYFMNTKKQLLIFSRFKGRIRRKKMVD